MADDRKHRASSPWESDNAAGYKAKSKPIDGAVKVKHRRQDALFSSSASAKDLRCLDMEKEKEDVSSPRGVLEACGRGLESDAGSSKISSTEMDTRSNSSWRKFFKLWKKSSFKRLASFPPLGVSKTKGSTRENPEWSNFSNFKSSLVNLSLSDLQTATNNFSRENLIGKGGYAEVYKGRLQDGQLIAVKRLTSGTADERTSSFLSELGIIAHVDHPNTAKLIGCGIEGGMHLIFQLSPLGSLGSLLHGSKDNKLAWSKRYKIALGTADGLLYLHENCQRRIIHRDIKADNILLTEDFEPQKCWYYDVSNFILYLDFWMAYTHWKYASEVNIFIYDALVQLLGILDDVYMLEICDFGLAKWLPKHWTHHSVSKFEGTFGYFAPEYFMHGTVDEKIDVYSFGVLLLELITGRRALDHLQQSLVVWAKPLLDKNDIKGLADPSLGDDYNIEQMDRVVLTASMCIEQSPILRPRMNQVVILLRGDDYVWDCAPECQRRSLQRTYSEELLDAQEYNSTKYLSDLKRHQEVALGS